tara:strand:- start:106 stop:480 length:375 start_codon:yes stop_codon:yes gene_type:complete
MIIYEYFTLFCTIIFFPLLIYFLIKHFKKSSEKNRIEENIKLYYDDDFKQCIEIISKRLNNTEFEKVSDVLYNLMRGYDYGFTDSINYAFYNELKSINKKIINKNLQKVSILKLVKQNFKIEKI